MREKIAEVIKDCAIYYSCWQGQQKLYQEFADEILSLPSGIVAKKECNESTDYLRFQGKHPSWCRCEGAGIISRQVSIGEALEVVRTMGIKVRMKGENLFYLPSGERLEVEEK